MGIAFDASSRNIAGSATTSTVSHTCTGSNLILWAATQGFKTGDNTDYLTSITYNGVAMTKVGSTMNFSSGLNLYLHYLVAPATGANNLVATFSTTMDEIDSRNSSFTGAKQSTQPDTNTASGPTAAQTSLSISTTTSVDGDWLVGQWRMGGALTAGANTTIPAAFAGEASALIYSTTDRTPAGSFSLVCTAASGTVGGIMASFKPAQQTLTMTAVVGAFTLTGVAAGIGYLYTLVASLGTYTLTGIAATLRFDGWTSQTKNSATFTAQSKNSATWASHGAGSKHSATWTSQTKRS